MQLSGELGTDVQLAARPRRGGAAALAAQHSQVFKKLRLQLQIRGARGWALICLAYSACGIVYGESLPPLPPPT